MLNDRIKLIKQDGLVAKDDVPASVQRKVYVNDLSLPVGRGDTIEYTTLAGRTRKLVVTDYVIYNVGSRLDHIEIEYVED